jgi:hypothetical protein
LFGCPVVWRSERGPLERWDCASSLDDLSDAVSDAAEGRTQRSHALIPRWPTDGPKLIDRWLRGKVEIGVQMRLRPSGPGSKPCQYLATLQLSRLVKDVPLEKLGGVVAEFESKLHPGAWREDEGREVKVPVLVDLPKLIEDRQCMFLRKTALRDDLVRLTLFDQGDVVGITPASFPLGT